MNFRRSTTANLTETVLHYNALAKDAGITLRSSWPSMASNESISMLGMYGPNQSFNSSGNHVNSQAGPRLVQAGKYCSATANFLTTAGPSLQAGGGNAACSGLTGQRDYLLPKSLAAEVHSSDGFLHGSSTMRLPFLQSASRSAPALRSINGSAMSGVANLGPSLTHGDGDHIGLSSLASPGRSADHDLHGQNLASGSAMNLQTISSDFGQFFSWVPNLQDPAGEDCWAVSDNDTHTDAFQRDAAALVSSSNKENGQSRQDSVPAGSYSSSGGEVSLCASKRQRVSWEASCDANVVQDQQLPCTIILDDDMEMLTAASCNYGSAQALLQLRQSRCLLPAESSNGNKVSNIPESRLRANRGHNIRDIQAVRGKVSCTASGNSPRSVLAVDSNLQGGTSQLQSTQQQLNVSIATMGTGVYDACTMPFGQTVYQQPCANSQLSQTSHSDMTFAALHQPLDVPATAIASNCQKQVQMDGCADMDAKTTCSSGGGGKPGDVHVTCSSFMEEAITSGGRKFQQLPSFSSLGISSGGNVSDSIAPHTKVEFLSPTAHAPKSSSQMYAGDESNLSWPPDSYDRLGASSCPMPTLDSLSSTINGWVVSHADNLLRAGLKTRDARTWQSKLSTLPTNTAAGRVIANVQEHANNDHNLRKRPSEDFMDSACKRLKDGIKGNDLVTSGPPTRSCSPMTSSSNHKGLGPALNTNLKPRARQGSANDPQSIAARHRRERISERLKMLQDLVPNGSKVDLVTMLEKAISYVKSLQLQVKFLTADEYWPDANKGCTPHVEGISLEVAARMMTESLEAAVKFESDPKGNRQEVLSVMDDSFLMD